MLKKISGIMTAGLLLASAVTISATGDDDLRKAVIKDIKNKVELKYGTSEWREGRLDQMVRPGTTVRTGSLSRAELMYADGTLTRIGSRTSMVVMDKDIRAVKVEGGKLWFKVTPKSAGLKIYTPTAVAAITGTEGFAEFKTEDSAEEEKQSFGSPKLIASSGKNFFVSQNSGNSFYFGLTNGTANLYRVNNNGEPTGAPINVTSGMLFTFQGGNFTFQNVGSNFIRNQNSDISSPDGGSSSSSSSSTGSTSSTSSSSSSTSSTSSSSSSGSTSSTSSSTGSTSSTSSTSSSSSSGSTSSTSSSTSSTSSGSPANDNLGPTNVNTEQLPNVPNKQQDINNSPTTGDLEIIIK